MRPPRPGTDGLAALVLFGALAVQGATAFGATSAGPGDRAAVELRSGSVARQQLIALGRDLIVAGVTEHNAVAINGDAEVSGSVGGDLIVLGGEARLRASARVAGDVFVLGGTLSSDRGAVIDGRSVAYPAVPRSWLVLLEGPALGLDPFSAAVLGAKLALIAAWLVTGTLLVAAFARPLGATAREVADEPFRSFFVGVVAVLSMVLTLLFFSALAPATVGVPLMLLMVLFALVLKLWGTVAVFEGLGGWLARRVGRGERILGPHQLTTVAIGLGVLGLAKLMPWVGVVVWTVVTFIGVGAALSTKLGRLEPWLEA